jgi:hypothetical protein
MIFNRKRDSPIDKINEIIGEEKANDFSRINLPYTILIILILIALFFLTSAIFGPEITTGCTSAYSCNNEYNQCQTHCTLILKNFPLLGYDDKAEYANCLDECTNFRNECFDSRSTLFCRVLFK